MAWFKSRKRVEEKREVRVGFVDTFLTRPLVRGIEYLVRRADIRAFDAAAIGRALAEGEVDVALVPSAEVVAHPEYRIVPTVCAGTFGGGGLAVLCSKMLPTEVQSVVMDREGHALEGLLEVLLPRQVMIRPRIEHTETLVAELGPEAFSDPTRAFLFTGSCSLRIPQHEGFYWTWDVMQAWKKYTSLPFVFWLWAVRPNADLQGLESELSSLLVGNLSRLDEFCGEQALLEKTEKEILKKLYSKVMHYTLDNLFLAGLRRYAKELSDAGVTQGQAPIRPYSSRE
jgi:chorismate dehydratase